MGWTLFLIVQGLILSGRPSVKYHLWPRGCGTWICSWYSWSRRKSSSQMKMAVLREEESMLAWPKPQPSTTMLRRAWPGDSELDRELWRAAHFYSRPTSSLVLILQMKKLSVFSFHKTILGHLLIVPCKYHIRREIKPEHPLARRT